MRIRKSRYIESDGTCCYIEKFNVVFSLCRVLEVTFYFSKGFLEAAAEALQPFGVTMAMTPSLAKNARGPSTVGSSRTCPYGSSRENKCSDGVP